jgi:hypothetical protein
MFTRQARRVINYQRSEAATLKRVVERWVETGTVPVVHIVADLDELEGAPVKPLPALVPSAPNATHVAAA